jgi:hypothetical protein
VSPPNKVINTQLVNGTIGIFFSKKYTTINAIIVVMIKGGIATFKLFSVLKYTIKKIRRGPKSLANLIKGLCIIKC